MHELSLAQSIADVVAESAAQRGIRRVSRVIVVVGEWSSVVPEALAVGFQFVAAAAGDLLAGAELQVIPEPVQAECTSCGHAFAAGQTGLTCPVCGGPARLTAGMALQIDSYEGE